MSVVIKQRNSNVFDVFFGKVGFDENEWACFLREGGRLKLIKGSPVSSSVYQHLCNTLLRRK